MRNTNFILALYDSQPLPRHWRQLQHPNGDVYYYNSQLRAVTALNVRDHTILRGVMNAHDNHMQALDDDISMRRMPPDLELVIVESNSVPSIIWVKMYSRARGEGYTWVEEDGTYLAHYAIATGWLDDACQGLS